MIYFYIVLKLCYKKMWLLYKVENGWFVGDDFVFEVYGVIVFLEGGLLLNGNDFWLDMGDFEGEWYIVIEK